MDQQPTLLYRTNDVRGMDRHAIETLGVDGYLLMTRAAQASFDTLRQVFGAARSLLVLCGSGNNAGDGYVLARLAVDAGFRVTVVALTAPDKLKGSARTAWLDFVGQGGQVNSFEGVNVGHGDVIVDALLGTGLDRPVRDEYLDAINWINRAKLPVLSLDVPSGLDSDSGLPQPVAVEASVTTTFIAPKVGLYTGRASMYCGKVVIHGLELPTGVLERYRPVARLLSIEDVRSCLPRRRMDAHKGMHGRVLIVGGNIGMSGAVELAAAAALRSGAGTVTVACHPENREIVAGSMAELMCVGVAHAEALEPLLKNCDVIAIGPGLGRDEWGRALLNRVIQCEQPVVIDADGLRLVADIGHLPLAGARVLTPHPGEAAALVGTTSALVQDSRLEMARLIGRRYGSVVALKGAGTIVAGHVDYVALKDAEALVELGVEAGVLKDTGFIVETGIETTAVKDAGAIVETAGEAAALKDAGAALETVTKGAANHDEMTIGAGMTEVAICNLGNPGMATAGTGDVLTGITAGIWAQQADRDCCAFEVTCAAVYVHAAAGDEAAKDGERGLIASDLLAQVRQCANIKL